MAELELSDDHDRLIRLEARVDSTIETTNGKLDELKTLMTNHLAHHEATEIAQLESQKKTEEKKGDRWFKIGNTLLQVIVAALLSYLIYHIK